MSSAGIVLIITGVWVVSQVTVGDALQRLGILPDAQQAPPKDIGLGPGVTVPDRGYGGSSHDAWGRPY